MKTYPKARVLGQAMNEKHDGGHEDHVRCEEADDRAPRRPVRRRAVEPRGRQIEGAGAQREKSPGRGNGEKHEA